MKMQMKKLHLLMNLFIATGERFMTEYSPFGTAFTFEVEDDVLTVIKDNETLVTYDKSKGTITHNIEFDDFECLIDCLVWVNIEFRTELKDELEALASDFYHIGRTIKALREAN
ncbi:hypothetical protein [Pseudomonas phage D6]|nr:hypothetical protein [Pseudomonas phage D6]